MGDARVRVKEKLESWALFEDLHAKTLRKWCRRERHGSSESWVRRFPASSGVFRCPWPAIDGTLRGPVARDR